jgi:hypothetical protein
MYATMAAELAHPQIVSSSSKEIEEHAGADINRIWSGGAETRVEELLNARAAVSALIHATIFEHPALFNLCTRIARLPVR